MDAEWTASALFSPSKARAQQAQAKDWAAVDSWLAKRYPSRLPIFERNEDTLHALLTLANFSENADEQRGQVDRIEKTTFQAIAKRQGGIGSEVVQALILELSGEAHLDTLAEALVSSDCPNANVAVMGAKIVNLTSSEFEMAQQMKHVKAQVDALKTEQDRLQKVLQELESDAFRAPADIAETTAEWQKTTKHLTAKIAEYKERLSASQPGAAPNSIEDVQRRADDVGRQRDQLASLETQLKAYQDLPTDTRGARRKLEEARDQLRRLTSKRDQLFEDLVDT